MEIYRYSELRPGYFRKSIVTIGIFDGVHRGHVSLLRELKNIALREASEAVVITLWPHPRMVLFPDKSIKLLTTLEEKLSLLEKQGISKVILIDFNEQFARIPARDFIRQGLVGLLDLSYLVLGYDNHFGHNKEGRIDVVKQEANQFGFRVVQLPPVFHGEEVISSTNIRLHLELGNIEAAKELLGYPFFVKGKVVEGNRMGRTLNFPTANLQVEPYKMLPRVGVYAVWANVDGNTYPGMMNIGFRPTIQPHLKEKTLEVHLINFEGDLYGKEITVTFVQRTRDEIKFPGITELRQQLEEDRKIILQILS
ncbi:MAG TPA: bifunctional riboflavin kinase/FAD synthetase [Bacteroidales bacterium]|mgnify:CR=1 FL=1|nr:bifunctional riboflavin kinase/FAD synthetase [Bacteroidales bacterium]HOK98594.1 bifunctional riboflavin kinase/FAD synthetase [Bacteroidales bacterium]HPO66345.1 bifunctional riboflavin kinase/FAD synthetase [Bacteroidales bacterium]